MVVFDLQAFILKPSWEQIDKCRKDDLLIIASHYDISVEKQALKKEIKRLVETRLVELKILQGSDEGGEGMRHSSMEARPADSLNELGEGLGEGLDEVDAEAEADGKPALPPFYPFSPVSTGSREDVRLKVRLARMQMETQEKMQARQAELDMRVQIRKLEIEADTQVRLRQLELDAAKAAASPAAQSSTAHSPVSPPPSDPSSLAFDVSRYIALVPQFRESEVDTYFNAFERIASALRCPKDVWSLLLQCKLIGKAQEVCSTLSLEDSLQYDTVKSAVLRAYELVPEAYRQRFRNHKKNSHQTFVEFSREKSVLFDKWCAACQVTDFAKLRELLLIEEFKSCLPEKVVVYLNEQKVSTVSQAAVLADEFVLTHKNVFTSVRPEKSSSGSHVQSQPSSSNSSPQTTKNDLECYYCHKKGHKLSDCIILKRKQQQPKSVGFVNSVTVLPSDACNSSFAPFLMKGWISLSGEPHDQKEVQILRDTGAAQSFILSDCLPLSDKSYCCASVLVQGFEMGIVNVPLHRVHLQCDLITGFVKVGVRSSLPVNGVDIILGNDLAGGKVMPVVEVLDSPTVSSSPDIFTKNYPEVFSACAVTRAQMRRAGEDAALDDTFMASVFADQLPSPPSDSESSSKAHSSSVSVRTHAPLNSNALPLNITRDQMCAAQRKDPNLSKCFDSALDPEVAKKSQVAYFVEDGLLMRKWSPNNRGDLDWSTVYQIVIPDQYRQQILSLAHDHHMSGHLGVTKTYDRIIRHFFWPGMKKNVAEYCRTCHTCQVTGKPNQVIPPAPLVPIPVIGEPFENVIVDCVGPLPKTKSGNQFLLTIMCRATRFPEAVPLRKITASAVSKALVKFFSTFGLPKVVQTDQGTNFLSKLFSQILKTLGISHRHSSAYHPESQGALERFHQTLKSMLRKYAMDTEKDWDEGVPLVLFAVRETVQESLGFSPADLIYAHGFRGPLKILKENILNTDSNVKCNILDFVSRFRERLHAACSLARESLSVAQSGMKRRYDANALSRCFQPGDEVLVLLPIPGSALSARFSGPYRILEKISDTDYVIDTPDRRRQSRVCYINMLKPYHSRTSPITSTVQIAGPAISSAAVCDVLSSSLHLPSADDDGVVLRKASVQSPRLSNSDMLKRLSTQLDHLSIEQQKDVECLIYDFPQLFGDIPTQTTVLKHDIKINCSAPIKQHAYRVNTTKRSIMRTEAEYLLDNNLAVHSSSPWSSPCLLVPKPDGTYRFCTDYRKINAVTVPDSYPLPRMEDCIDSLGTAQFVTKLDLLKGYWQIPLSPQASEISAFVTPDYFLQYSVMAFGMRNAPATFQRLVNIVLAGVPNCNAYLDDLVVYSSDWKEHIALLRTVFERLANASLTLNLAKCEFGQATVTYLGKEVGKGQVRPVEAKVTAISEFPIPKTRRELRRFLGMSGYYRSFCRNFSTVVNPLTNLLSPAVPYVWTEECQRAFDNVKALLCSKPVLAAPDVTKAFKLEVDASGVGAGAVLMQEDNFGIDHPICYFSKKFNKHQLNYSTIEKEALALLLAVQYFEVYIGSTCIPVAVYTDHNPLVFLSRMFNQNQRLMRWSLILQDYNLTIFHKKGAENVVADALSRA